MEGFITETYSNESESNQIKNRIKSNEQLVTESNKCITFKSLIKLLKKKKKTYVVQAHLKLILKGWVNVFF